MKLFGTLMADGIYDQLIAVVEPITDTVEPHGPDHIRRRIEAKVKEFGPLWQKYLGFWSKLGMAPASVDGREFFFVNHLQIDHDFYPFHSLLNVEGDTVRIAVVEMCDEAEDDLSKYYTVVNERNERVQKYLDAWEHATITADDVRALMGLPPFGPPAGTRTLSRVELSKVESLRHYATLGLSRNTIV